LDLGLDPQVDLSNGLTQQGPGGETNFIKIPPANESSFVLKKKSPILVRFYDAGVRSSAGLEPDGDSISVTLNGQLIANNILLGKYDPLSPVVATGTNTVALRLRPGINTVGIKVTGVGKVPTATVGYAIEARAVNGDGGTNTAKQKQLPGVLSTTSFDMGYIRVEAARINNETTGGLPHPSVVGHIDRAWRRFANAFPNDPMAGRFCTSDGNKAAADARRSSSLAASGIATQPGKERDEYPPAACLENGGSADVESLPKSENESAGGVFGNGINRVPVGYPTELVIGPLPPGP
jgi:Deoxyribonuclease NucA/NucB